MRGEARTILGKSWRIELTNDLGERTKRYAVQIIRLCGELPKDMVAHVIGKQVLRSGTSVGAQYREARRARSDSEFISKVECALQELDETLYWLELLDEVELIADDRLGALMKESEELIAIFVSSVRTVKQRRESKRGAS